MYQELRGADKRLGLWKKSDDIFYGAEEREVGIYVSRVNYKKGASNPTTTDIGNVINKFKEAQELVQEFKNTVTTNKNLKQSIRYAEKKHEMDRIDKNLSNGIETLLIFQEQVAREVITKWVNKETRRGGTLDNLLYNLQTV